MQIKIFRASISKSIFIDAYTHGTDVNAFLPSELLRRMQKNKEMYVQLFKLKAAVHFDFDGSESVSFLIQDADIECI